jgi:hypothetical protein
MIQRGRKAASAKVVVVEGGFARRPDPPADLTERQVEIWREVTSSEDPDFFATGATRGLLADYCRRRDAGENLSAIINSFKPEWIKSADGALRYKQLLQMRDIEIRGSASLAVKLRLTNQARYHHERAGTTARKALARVAKPWEL